MPPIMQAVIMPLFLQVDEVTIIISSKSFPDDDDKMEQPFIAEKWCRR